MEHYCQVRMQCSDRHLRLNAWFKSEYSLTYYKFKGVLLCYAFLIFFLIPCFCLRRIEQNVCHTRGEKNQGIISYDLYYIILEFYQGGCVLFNYLLDERRESQWDPDLAFLCFETVMTEESSSPPPSFENSSLMNKWEGCISKTRTCIWFFFFPRIQKPFNFLCFYYAPSLIFLLENMWMGEEIPYGLIWHSWK